MKMIELKCQNCGNKFERRLHEHTRNIKLGRKPFCDNSCSTEYNNSLRTKEDWKRQYEKQKKTFDIKDHAGNLRDEYSPFRFFLNKGRRSIKRHLDTIDIDKKYLKELWEKQNGICSYTGIKMILPETSSQKKHLHKSLKLASLDRIDSNGGYTKDNVEFVCMAINLGKNNHTKKEMMSFINDIISNTKITETTS